jgi:multiple sugar transport system ATP-binding protein
MGRAIVRDPQVFLFDEPLSNLDAKLRVQMRAEIRELHQRLKSTTLYVTHDQIEAMTMADKIVVMQDGYIEQIGSPLELYDRPSNVFVAGFIGSPAMNLIPGITKKSGKSFAVEIFGTKLPLPKIKNLIDGQEVLIGVRPEQLIPGKSGIPATVAIVEPTGSETHLIVRSGEQELISVIRERSSFSVGEEILLSSDKSSLHIFDSKTSERLNDD